MDTNRILHFEKHLSNMSNQQTTGLGARLREAREALHLSTKDAASHLHLNVKMINIMEAEDFTNGPPSTFIRGYIRSYGKLLKIEESEIQSYLENLELTHLPNPFNFAPPIMSTRETSHYHKFIRSITYLVVLGMIGLMCLWWNAHSHEKIKPVLSQINETKNTKLPIVELSSPPLNFANLEAAIENASSLTKSPLTSIVPVLQNSIQSVDSAIALSSDEDDDFSTSDNVDTIQRG